MKTVAIIQPSLFPWRGYFRIISRSHIFVFFDDVQFDKRGWRNRNQIVSNQGLQWFTVPVITKGKFLQKINQTQISYEDPKWTKKILQTFQSNYGKAKYFSDYFPWLEQKFNSNPQNISDFAIETTKDICHFLKIKTEFIKSSDLNIPDDVERVDRLITICQRVSGTHYLSGPSASEYIGEGLKFKESNLTLEYQTYDLPSYPQPRSPFIGEASILDLLFHCGQESHLYI